MRKHLRFPKALPLALCVMSLEAVAFGDEPVEIPNWPAPHYWVRPASGRHSPDAAAVRPELVPQFPSAPALLVAINPCRILDTRPGFSAAYHPGVALPGFIVTTFDLNSAPSPCNNVPSNAVAYSLNVTVAAAPGSGYLSAFPGSTAPNPLTSLVNFAAGETIANASVVPGDSSGLVGFYPSTAIHIVVDINGYYVPQTVVNTLNTLSGDVTLAQGANVTITPSGNTLTIAATGGGGGGGGVTSIAGTNGISASPATGAVTVTSNATSANTISTIVARDSGGSFNASFITLTNALNLTANGGGSFVHGQGQRNAFVGTGAGNVTLNFGSSTDNTGAGFGALFRLTTGNSNAAFGAGSLSFDTSGSHNSAFGQNSLANLSDGSENTAFGREALQNNVSGSNNTAFGSDALQNHTVSNTSAFGTSALRANTTGTSNSAFGTNAMQTNVSGAFNAAFGGSALFSSTGSNNTALGVAALNLLTSGSNNIAIGSFAGTSLGSGSNNIYVGADTIGNESDVIRIGGTQTATVIKGIYGANQGASGLAVFVASDGRLGTTPSSKRYKEDIIDMGEESDVLLKLRPVSFFYKLEYDPSRTRQYGLIAEEVAEVAPALAVFDKEGQPETVRYHLVNAMLLNEVQKQRKTLDAQALELEELHAILRDLGRRVEMLSRASRR